MQGELQNDNNKPAKVLLYETAESEIFVHLIKGHTPVCDKEFYIAKMQYYGSIIFTVD